MHPRVNFRHFLVDKLPKSGTIGTGGKVVCLSSLQFIFWIKGEPK